MFTVLHVAQWSVGLTILCFAGTSSIIPCIYILDRLNRREECINSCPVKKGFVTNPIETRLRVGCFLCKWFVQVKTMA